MYAFYHFCKMLVGFLFLFLLKPCDYKQTRERLFHSLEIIKGNKRN